MPTILRKLRLKEISLVDKGANEGAKVVFAKRAGNDTRNDNPSLTAKILKLLGIARKPVEKQMTLEEILAKLTDEEKAVVLAALEEAAKKVPVAAADPNAPPAPPAPAPGIAPEVAKGLPEEVTKAFEKSAAEKAELEKRVKAMEDTDSLRVFVAKAADLQGLAGMPTDELGAVLKSASESLTKEQYEKLEKALQTSAAMVRKGALVQEYGSAGEGAAPAPGQTEALAKAHSLAKGLMDADPKLTKIQAVNKAFTDNPELHQQHRAQEKAL